MIYVYFATVLCLGLGALAALQFKTDSGYVLLGYGGYTLETSLLGAGLALTVAVLVVFYGLKLVGYGFGLPQRLARRAQRQRAQLAQAGFEQGLQKLFEGQWAVAEAELIKRVSDHRASHLSYLAAARAAQRLGAPERRDRYLALVREQHPSLEFMITLTQAELQRERGEFSLLTQTALQLRALSPEHLYALELLAESYFQQGRWQELRSLLGEARTGKALGSLRRQEWGVLSTVALLQQSVKSARLDELKSTWVATDSAWKTAPSCAQAYAMGLRDLNAAAEARAFIEKRIASAWDPVLAKIYAPLHADDPVAQLATLERWLNQYGENPTLLLSAGQVCLKNKLWGKAQSYLDAVLQKHNSAQAHALLADLYTQTQQPVLAQQHTRLGLAAALLAANAD